MYIYINIYIYIYLYSLLAISIFMKDPETNQCTYSPTINVLPFNKN